MNPKSFTWLRRDAIQYLQYLVLRCIFCLIQSISLQRCDRICSVLAYFFSTHIHVRRRLVDANLKLIFPEWSVSRIDETRRAMWHHLFMMVCEIAHAPRKIHRTNWRDFYTIPDRDQVVRVLMDPRPKIFVSGHFGNFEMSGFVAGVFGIPTTAIARPLDNRFIHRYIQQFRSQGGQHMLAKDGSATEIQSLLGRGGTLALLADQDAGNKGCWVEFLGKPASCHKALALFTLSSGAPMVVMAAQRTRPLNFHLHWLGTMDPEISCEALSSVSSLTQWYNQQLASVVREYPEQYWWVHNRWRDPPARLRKQAAA